MHHNAHVEAREQFMASHFSPSPSTMWVPEIELFVRLGSKCHPAGCCLGLKDCSTKVVPLAECPRQDPLASWGFGGYPSKLFPDGSFITLRKWMEYKLLWNITWNLSVGLLFSKLYCDLLFIIFKPLLWSTVISPSSRLALRIVHGKELSMGHRVMGWPY